MWDEVKPWTDARSWSRVMEEAMWEKLSHAYGPAGDTPTHLNALLDGDASARKAAEHHLVSAIIHQGTPWSATYPVALVVLKLLDDPEVAASIAPSREAMLDFLGELADFLDQFSGEDWENLRVMANATFPGFYKVIDWAEIEQSEALTNAYHSQAALQIRRLEARILGCLGEP